VVSLSKFLTKAVNWYSSRSQTGTVIRPQASNKLVFFVTVFWPRPDSEVLYIHKLY
jgi:hypothetical protein